MRATQVSETAGEFITAFPGSWLFGTRLTFQGSGRADMAALLLLYDSIDEAARPLVYLESAHLIALS